MKKRQKNESNVKVSGNLRVLCFQTKIMLENQRTSLKYFTVTLIV